MENPAKVNSTPEVPDFYQRQRQRMTVPVAGEDVHDAPPPYEAPRPAAVGGGSTSTSASAPAAATDSARSSSSSVRDEHAGFLDGFLEGLLTPREQFSRLQDQKRQQRQGYSSNEPMSLPAGAGDAWEDRNWDHLDGRPGSGGGRGAEGFEGGIVTRLREGSPRYHRRVPLFPTARIEIRLELIQNDDDA
ncbi:hypothetical protein CMUS01_11249 [Colletotrichum musicola]|uniref:Uncharacterized protein n=1 Tax=Colletotrichum musicola TaxID=2175873 RepID=A0A8H6N6J2_9PEZI|nr:hypothetical protein CMUS01_11249 [Colletotrichum musicola]